MRLLLVMTYRDTEVELAEARALKEMLLELNRERLAEPLRLARFNREADRRAAGDPAGNRWGDDPGISRQHLSGNRG